MFLLLGEQPVFHCPPAGRLGVGERLGGDMDGRADPNWPIPNDTMTCSTLKAGKKNKRVGALPSREDISQRLGEHKSCLREMVSGLCIT